MLTKADDFPIHQTPEPIAFSGTDRNFYDRYFFNGYAPDGSVFFAAAMGIYPHLNIIDASFCVVVDGKQHNLHASRVLGMERMDLHVGPISIIVEEPLQRLRVKVASNEHGVAADVVFHCRAPAVAEPRFTYRIGPRTVMDYTRLTQNGVYSGYVEAGGKRFDLSPERIWGTRDRSWGVRPVGAQDSQGVAPPRAPQFYWLWAPLNFEDRFTLFHDNAEASGASWNTAAVMGMTGGAAPSHMARCASKITFKSGTRHARSADITFSDADGADYRVQLTPRWQFYMAGLGYMNPQWGHGHYKGAEAVGFELFDLANENENAFDRLHVQAFCEARLEGPNGLVRHGSGVLEQLIIGPHAPSSFKDLLDLAP